MVRDAVLLTGFEPFLDVAQNPSGEVARALDGVLLGDGLSGQPGSTASAEARPGPEGPGSYRPGSYRPDSHRIVGRELPVTFGGAPSAFDAALEAAGGSPALALCLGVHRGHSFRLETRAGARFASEQPDNDGEVGGEVVLAGPDWRVTTLDVAGRCAEALTAAGAPEVTTSEDAGGYLCERVFRAALDRGEERGFPALFLHVPPVEVLGPGEQARIVEGFLARLLAPEPTPRR